MTDISISSVQSQVEKRSWLLSPHGTEPGTNPNATLDVSAFTPATHYPNGFFPSGLPVTELATGLWGPFDVASARKSGLVFASTKVPNPADTTKDVATGLVVHGFVRLSKLPQALAAADQAKFPLIYFSA